MLSPRDLESFIELGYCTVPGAFTAQQATAACRCVWERMAQKAGIQEADPRTWPAAYDIEEHLESRAVLACFTDRLAAAVAQLVGPGRWRGARRWGLWPVNFSLGRERPYEIPDWGWHIDGNWFTHTLDCPKQGLVVLGLFTDVEPRGGGTILASGSHKRTARVLAQNPHGMEHRDLFREVLQEPLGNFHEVTGAAGDVTLCHPFLFHTRGLKHRGAPRIISNTETPLIEPLRLERAVPGEYSILEESIRRALTEAPVAPADARMCHF